MIVIDGNPHFRAELETEISRVAAYLMDLEGLAVGSYPMWHHWSQGQRLFGAVRAQRPTTCLQGRLVDGRQIYTKPLLIYAEEKRWARTADGIYRLVPEGGVA